MNRSLHARMSAVATAIATAVASPIVHADEPTSTPAPAPAPTTTTANAESAEKQPGDAKTWKTPLGLRFDGGWSPRRLFDISTSGGDLGAAFGAQTSPNVALWAAGRFFVGSTEYGLSTWAFRLGGEAEYVIDRLRIGGGLSLALIGVGRAARDETLRSWGPEVRAHVRFDAIQADAFAVFLRAAVDATWEVYDGSAFWGPTVGGGIDFDIAGQRPR